MVHDRRRLLNKCYYSNLKQQEDVKKIQMECYLANDILQTCESRFNCIVFSISCLYLSYVFFL